MKADIHDRRSIERIYPPEAFAVDAAHNQQQPANPVLHGVRIASAPDRNGAFTLERASRHVGESGGAPFLAPFRPLYAGRNAAGRIAPPADRPDPDPREGYGAFVDDIIKAAEQLGYREELSPGPGDARLRGPRQ
jgi:hypothetical protein